MGRVRSFSFDENQFPELDAWLERLSAERGRLSREVVRVLNAHVAGIQPAPAPENANLTQVLTMLERIEARLDRAQLSASPEHAPAFPGELPDDVRAALDALAL